MELSTHLKNEKPAPVGKPEAGYQNELSTAILASGARSVSDLMADLASVNEEISERRRFLSLQTRAELCGLELSETQFGLKLAGPGFRCSLGDLATVNRALRKLEVAS